jgi:hypothetical protein
MSREMERQRFYYVVIEVICIKTITQSWKIIQWWWCNQCSKWGCLCVKSTTFGYFCGGVVDYDGTRVYYGEKEKELLLPQLWIFAFWLLWRLRLWSVLLNLRVGRKSLLGVRGTRWVDFRGWFVDRLPRFQAITEWWGG